MSDKLPEDVLELAKQRIHVRQEQQRIAKLERLHERNERERPWRYAFLAVVTVLVIGLLFTPGVPLSEKMYIVLHGMCSQQHTIVFGGIEFPICARCSGIYISSLTTLFYLWGLGRFRAGHIPPISITATLVLFVGIMAVDGFHSMAVEAGIGQLYTPLNEVRFLTGIGVGVGIAMLILLMINMSLRKNVDDQLPVFKNWREFGIILLINFLVMVAIYGNIDILALPLAVMAFVGMLLVIYAVNVLVVSLVMGYDGAITNLTQLARPATIAIIPTSIIVGGMSLFRYWLETHGFMPRI